MRTPKIAPHVENLIPYNTDTEAPMTTITITLPNDRFRVLEKMSKRLNLAPEELARLSVEELISRPDESFQDAMKYVLEKNAELYQRLAT